MTVHTAFTGFLALEPGAMIFLESDVPLVAGDVLVVTLAQVAETRMTVKEMRPSSVEVIGEGWGTLALEVTLHGLSDFPVLIVPLPKTQSSG